MLATLPDPTRTTTPSVRRPPPVPASSAGGRGTLVARVATGDDRAFAALVRRHETMLRAVVGRILDGAAEVDDVVQETFLAAWLRMADLVEGDAVAGWLATTARRRSYDRLRPRSAPSRRTAGGRGRTDRRLPGRRRRARGDGLGGRTAPRRPAARAAALLGAATPRVPVLPRDRRRGRPARVHRPRADRPGTRGDPQCAAGLALTARPVDRRTGGAVPAGPVPPVRRVVTTRARRPRSRSGRRAGRRSTCGPPRSSGPRRAPSAPPGR